MEAESSQGTTHIAAEEEFYPPAEDFSFPNTLEGFKMVFDDSESPVFACSK